MLSGGLPSVVGGKTSAEDGHQTSLTKSRDEVFDLQWKNIVGLLNRLKTQLVDQSTDDMRIGQLVDVSGKLSITDLDLVKKLFETKSLKKMLTSDVKKGNRQQRRASGQTEFDQTELVFETLALLPHAITATLEDGALRFWCTLDKESLIVPSHEVLLKHGIEIAGDWNILGVVDSVPETENFRLDIGTPDVMTEGFGALIGPLVPIVRTLLGRPTSSFGISPLIIYRGIS